MSKSIITPAQQAICLAARIRAFLELTETWDKSSGSLGQVGRSGWLKNNGLVIADLLETLATEAEDELED